MVFVHIRHRYYELMTKKVLHFTGLTLLLTVRL